MVAKGKGTALMGRPRSIGYPPGGGGGAGIATSPGFPVAEGAENVEYAKYPRIRTIKAITPITAGLGMLSIIRHSVPLYQ